MYWAGEDRGHIKWKGATLMDKTRREFVKMVGGATIGAGAVLAGRGRAEAQAVKPAKGVPSGPIKIGIMPILSGLGGVPGLGGLRASEIWRDRVNAEGGILGRKVEFYQEEETSPKETVEKFRKLTLQQKVDVISGGISTAVGLALGPVAEELSQLWLSWDATTQKGVEETMPKTKYTFRSTDNEMEAVGGGIMTAKHFPNIKTVAGINNDYSYGRDCWDTYKAVLNQIMPNVKFVLDLWPKLGETEFSSHIASIKKANPDLLFCSFWSGDVTIFFKQAAGVDLFQKMKGCFVTGGGVHDTLKKEFTPPGLILGYNSLYFKWTDSWPLLKWFVKLYHDKYKEYPPFHADGAFFTLQAYKAAVEKCYNIIGAWPTKEQIAAALTSIEVPSISGYRSYTEDNRMEATFFQGITTHKNPYNFVTIDPVEIMPASQIQKPAGTKLFDWIKSWKS
jgi:branched-chain amino acid transport system substrate-binding protein